MGVKENGLNNGNNETLGPQTQLPITATRILLPIYRIDLISC